MTKLISVLLVLGSANVADAALAQRPGAKPSVEIDATKPRPCVLPRPQLPHQPLPRCPSGFLGRMIQGSIVIRCTPVLELSRTTLVNSSAAAFQRMAPALFAEVKRVREPHLRPHHNGKHGGKDGWYTGEVEGI